jgi:hypothetical protein
MSLSALMKKGGLREVATANPANSATEEHGVYGTVARLATVAVAQPDDTASGSALTPEEWASLNRLAAAWGMDAEERAVMLQQCECGGMAVDGTKFTATEARTFWFAEAQNPTVFQ